MKYQISIRQKIYSFGYIAFYLAQNVLKLKIIPLITFCESILLDLHY